VPPGGWDVLFCRDYVFVEPLVGRGGRQAASLPVSDCALGAQRNADILPASAYQVPGPAASYTWILQSVAASH
jgi:hypothetical protein